MKSLYILTKNNNREQKLNEALRRREKTNKTNTHFASL